MQRRRGKPPGLPKNRIPSMRVIEGNPELRRMYEKVYEGFLKTHGKLPGAEAEKIVQRIIAQGKRKGIIR